MAKQSRTLERNYKIPQYLTDFENKKIHYLDFALNEETKLSDIEYYKDQSDNPIFMLKKEDLIKRVKNKLNTLKKNLEAETSPHKKKLLNTKINKIKKINLKFDNTWESYEATKLIYNLGDVLDESEIKELRERQRLIREAVKKAVFSNILVQKNDWVPTYVYCASSLWVQCLFCPAIITIIFTSLTTSQVNILEFIIIYCYTALMCLFVFPFAKYITEKLLGIIVFSDCEGNGESSKQLKTEVASVTGVVAANKLIEHTVHKTKDK